MRTISTGRRFLILSLTILCLAVFAGCDNPFDPLEDSDEIKGLTYIDFATEWAKWDSDPYSDGVLVTLEYLNQYGDSLEFTDKPHEVVIEMYKQRLVGSVNPYTTYGALVWSGKTTFRNTSDDIRVPVELYLGNLQAAGVENTGTGSVDSAKVYMIVRVHPPKGIPQNELVIGYPDIEVYQWEAPI